MGGKNRVKRKSSKNLYQGLYMEGVIQSMDNLLYLDLCPGERACLIYG